MGRIDSFPSPTVTLTSAQTLGYTELSGSSQGSITTEVDITGLVVTVTVPEGRRIRITASTNFYSDTADRGGDIFIYEGSTRLAGAPSWGVTAAWGIRLHASIVLTPTAGIHTYKARIQHLGTGNGTVYSTTEGPTYLLVEDITGQTAAVAPASVPVGQLAYAQATADQTGITTTLTDLTGLSINIVVPAGRTIRLSAATIFYGFTGAGYAEMQILEGATMVALSQQAAVAGGQESMNCEVVLSPSAGSHTYKARAHVSTGTMSSGANTQYPAFIMAEDITPTPAPASGAPGSTLAYAEVTANQTGITTAVDLTSLSVTVTVPAGRRIRVRGKALAQSSVDLDVVKLAILEGAGQLQQSGITMHPALWSASVEADVILSPGAGTHTYKLQMSRDNGTGTVAMLASASYPAYLLVEDITGAVWPQGSAVTAGMVASEQWTDWVPTIGQGATTNIAKTIGYSRYIKIGRMVTWEFTITITGTGTATTGIHLSAPVAGLAATNGMPIGGGGFVYDTSANTWYMGMPMFFTPDIYFLPLGSIGVGSQNLGIGNPIGTATMGAALANGDVIAGSVTYETAS